MTNKLDDKIKEQTDYLFNQIEPYLGDFDKPDVKKIIYKLNKVFYQEVEKQAITDFIKEVLPEEQAIPTEFPSDISEGEILLNQGFNKCLKIIKEKAKKFIN